MVVIHVKHKDTSQFLFETSLKETVDNLVKAVVAIYNGKLKIGRICCEIEELSKHGTLLPPEIRELTEEQVEELKLTDPWGEKCIPSDGFTYNKDPINRRNGKQPSKAMQEILKKAVADAKDMISAKLLVPQNICLTQKTIQEAINILKGAVTIVYPMKLPPHDTIRMEFENIEDLTNTQASLEVIDPATAQIWFCGKEMFRDDKLVGDYVGKIENTKVIMKISKRGEGPPGREPIMTEEQRKELMMHAYKRQEEFKKLEQDDDDNYLDSEWADRDQLKKTFHGLNNISWKM